MSIQKNSSFMKLLNSSRALIRQTIVCTRNVLTRWDDAMGTEKKWGPMPSSAVCTAHLKRAIVIQIIQVIDMTNHMSAEGIRLTYKPFGQDVVSVYLEECELDILIDALKSMQREMDNCEIFGVTSFSYCSKGRLKVGCYFEENDWCTYMQLDSSDENTFVKLKKGGRFTRLLAILEEVGQTLAMHSR